jgi:lysophospholipase L1-like esterase
VTLTSLARAVSSTWVLAAYSVLACSAATPSSGSGDSGGGAPSAGANAASAGAGAGGAATGGTSTGGAVTLGAGNSSGGAAGQAGGAAGQAGSSAGGDSPLGGAQPAGGAASGNGGALSGAAGSASRGGPLKLWLAGDSTVQPCSSACPCGWGSQFDALFDERVTVVNRAVGGRSIQTWLYEGAVTSAAGADGECSLSSQTFDARWRDLLDATSGMQPGDYLFIQFGINDGDRTCPRHVGIDAFQTYLKQMAEAAQQRGAQAIFVTPVSAIVCSGSKATATRGAFVDATKTAAAAAGVPVIDLHQASIALYDSLGFCPNDEDYTKGELGAFFCNDHTHFEAAGAKQIAELVAGALGAQAPDLAAYLK